MKPIDYSLYVLSDSKFVRGRTHRQVIQAAIRGGATIVQYREKYASTRHMIDEALDLCHAHDVSLIINDRVDVALAVNADGVHVGPEDMPASLARKVIGRDKILGVSAGNVEEARAAIADGADYLGVGAIFATSSKADAGAPIGIGIASGEMVAGVTGTEKRAVYTCLGDTVNLAARLEAQTKVVGQPILIAENTRLGLAADILVDDQGIAQLKGKTQAVQIFSVRTLASYAATRQADPAKLD
jgi:thiamine-phosphate pyrophosphorylase